MKSPVNIMSIDVEEWYHPEALRPWMPASRWEDQQSHVERQLDSILDLLEQYHVQATFFILGQVARAHPGLVRRIAEGGHEIASHGDGHRMITELNERDFERDLLDAREALLAAGAEEVLGYRAPTFSVMDETLWALDVIAKTGHAYDASIYPVHHDRYGMPNAPRFAHRLDNGLVELPGSTVRAFGNNIPVGGGGYLRLLPLTVNLAALEYLNRVEKEPFVVYFHPWEIDPAQPRIDLPSTRRARHYGFVDKMLGKLETLCRRFRFTSARQHLAHRGLL